MAKAAGLAFLLLLGCRSVPEPPEGEVWALVNGKPIKRAEVERKFRRELAGLPTPPTEAEALSHKLRLLGELIQQEILLQKAAQRGTLASDSEVEAALSELHAPYTDPEFQRQLEIRGLTLAELREELRRQLSVRKLLAQELAARIEVSDAEVTAYYQAHQEEFRHPEVVYHVAHILVTPRAESEVRNLSGDDAAGEAQARRKIEQLLSRLRAGEDFAELARNVSEDPNSALAGGDLGFFPESALEQSEPELRRTVRALAAGSTSGVVRTRNGYHLVKLLARQPAGQRDLSEPEVQESVRTYLRAKKQALLEAAYLEAVRNQAHVVNYLARQVLESGRALP
ncbi:MAG: peptidylprolyl isomerase [Terriglobia bacterium]